MLIFVVFAFVKEWDKTKIGYIILIGFFVLLFAGHFILNFLPILSNAFAGERYSDVFTADVDSSATLTGGLLWSLLFVIVLYISRFQSKNFKYLFFLYALYFMSYILTNLIWIGDRIGYYFAPFCIVVLPQMVSTTKSKIFKIIILVLFLGLLLNKFINFFTYDFVIEGYAKYQTIFSEF